MGLEINSTGVNTNYNAGQFTQAGKAKKAANAQPLLEMKGNQETKELGATFLDSTNKIDAKTIELKTIANDTTAILKDLGYDLKVTPAQVGRVGNIVTAEATPALNFASNTAELARTNPDAKSLETRMGFMMEDAFSQLDALMA